MQQNSQMSGRPLSGQAAVAAGSAPARTQPADDPLSRPHHRQGQVTTPLVFNILGAIVILAIGVGGFAIYGQRPEVPVDTSRQDAANAPPTVRTAAIRAWDAPLTIEVDGEASTYRILTVGAEVTGRILQKPDTTRSGTFVEQGTLLFEIDPVNYQLEVHRLQARVDQADQELAAVEVDIKNTASLVQLAEEDLQLQASQLQRVRSLFERRATSESEVDTAVRQELSARNALQMQQNQLNALLQQKKTRTASIELAKAELERAVVDLSRCQVVAPITGRIVDDPVEEGDYVKPGDPLVHISDSSRMEVKCSLQGEDVAWIWQQRPTEVTSQDVTGQSAGGSEAIDPFQMPPVRCEVVFEFQGVETIWDGVLSRYEGSGMDRQTRMFPARILVEEPQKTRVEDSQGGTAVSPPTLLSGMYVTVRIPIVSPAPLLQLPAEAVRPGEQLWVVRDGKLSVEQIRLVQVNADSALIMQTGNNIKSEDRVVISPLAAVTDGMPVQELSE